MAQEPCVFRQAGEVVDYTPSGAVTAGDVIVQGSLVGIALVDMAASQKGALCVRGVFDVPKDSSNLSAVGTAIYWDADGNPVDGTAGTGAFTATATANTFAGWCLETAGTGVGTVRALILSSFAVSVTTLDALTDVVASSKTAGNILVADGTNVNLLAPTGFIQFAAAGTTTIITNAVNAAGSSQGTGAAVAAGASIVSGADGTKAIVLPAAAAGVPVAICNAAAAALKVFPASGDSIDDNAADAGVTVAASCGAWLISFNGTRWCSMPKLTAI